MQLTPSAQIFTDLPQLATFPPFFGHWRYRCPPDCSQRMTYVFLIGGIQFCCPVSINLPRSAGARARAKLAKHFFTIGLI